MSTSPSKSKSTSTTYTPEQAQWMGKALETYGPELGKGQVSYPEERLAPLTGTQQQAMDVSGFLEGFAPYRDMPMHGETGQALSGILAGKTGAQKITPEMSKDLFSRIYETPAKKRYQEDILPGIQEAYAGPGYQSSARRRAQWESGQDLADWLGQKGGEFEWDVEQANRAIEEAKAGRALSAIQPGMAYGRQPTQEASARLAGRAGVFDFAGRLSRNSPNPIE